MKAKKGKSGYSEPCGPVEGPAKAKSRIKRFEQHLECNHRLANTYANNQPGEVPTMPGMMAGIEAGLPKHAAQAIPMKKRRKRTFGPVAPKASK